MAQSGATDALHSSDLCLLCLCLCLFIRSGAIAMQVQLDDSGDIDDGASYQFRYEIRDFMTNDYKTHEEIGKNGLVQGTYTVREPNGDLRVVSYSAGDGKGFQAMVRVRSIPSEKEIFNTQQEVEEPTLESYKQDNEDTPLKIQLGTKTRFYSFISDIGRNAEQSSQSLHNVSSTDATPSADTRTKILGYNLKSPQTGTQHRSFK